jgi:hypothetical protein
MDQVATWIFTNGEKIGGYLILLGLSYGFISGQLWSKKAVETRIADFEKREAKTIADCEYHRQAHERLLGELERALTVGKMLASKTAGNAQ